MGPIFLELLKKLLQAHLELIQLAEQKTVALVANDMERINELTRNDARLLSKVKNLEEQRYKVLLEWFPGEEPTTIKLERCASKLTGEEQLVLNDVIVQLVKAIEQLQILNERNQLLLMDSMRFVQLSLNLIAPREEELNYSNIQVESKESRRSSIFDSKA